jgi:hypothetical protein
MEILNLANMLKQENIPFECRELYGGYQVGYPVLPPSDAVVCDAIEHAFSYGYSSDRLELRGLLTPDEEEEDSVVGFLTAQEVFDRIKSHYESSKKGE